MNSPKESDNASMPAKQLLLWKEVKVKTIYGSDMSSRSPAILDLAYRGRLLSAILEMPKATPLSLAAAIQLYLDKTHEEIFVTQSGKSEWYEKNFVTWVSSLGYHINLTGDEFEAVAQTDKVA
jgi:hypothetical protein